MRAEPARYGFPGGAWEPERDGAVPSSVGWASCPSLNDRQDACPTRDTFSLRSLRSPRCIRIACFTGYARCGRTLLARNSSNVVISAALSVVARLWLVAAPGIVCGPGLAGWSQISTKIQQLATFKVSAPIALQPEEAMLIFIVGSNRRDLDILTNRNEPEGT